jgi:hypothetical protein
VGLCTWLKSAREGFERREGEILGDYASWECDADGPVSPFNGLENGCWFGGVNGSYIRGAIRGRIGFGLAFPLLGTIS